LDVVAPATDVVAAIQNESTNPKREKKRNKSEVIKEKRSTKE
jgi:hypothetical protein